MRPGQMTITDDDEKEKDINDINYQVTSYFTSIHCKSNPYKFSPLSIHFFRPLDCDANPCKNGGTCVEVPSRKTYKCNCTDESEVWGQMDQINNVHAICGEGAAEEGKKQNLLRNTKRLIYDLFY